MITISNANKVYPEINRCNNFIKQLDDIKLSLHRIISSVEEDFSGQTREAILESLNVLKSNCNNASESVNDTKRSLYALINSVMEQEAKEKVEKEKENGK